MSIGQFTYKYLLSMLLCYCNEVPQTLKTICVKCHSHQTLSSLVIKMCCQLLFKVIFKVTQKCTGSLKSDCCEINLTVIRTRIKE